MMVHAEIVITVAEKYKRVCFIEVVSRVFMFLHLMHLHSFICVPWEGRISVPNLKGARRVTCSMSYPVIAFDSWLKPWRCIVQWLLWRPVFWIIASFCAVMEPPCRDRYIPSFVCQQRPHSWPPGRVMYCRLHKIKHRHLKMWTWSRAARLFNLLIMIVRGSMPVDV